MARHIRSLHFNIKDGKDIQAHREHRSKRGQRKSNKGQKALTLQYKRKKQKLREELF